MAADDAGRAERRALATAAAAAAAAVVPRKELAAWRRSVAEAEGLLRGGQLQEAINEYTHLIRTALPLLLPPGVAVPLPDVAAGTCAGPSDPAAAAMAAVARWRDDQLAALLLARSQAHSALSHHLRSIPAAQSESRAIFAPGGVGGAGRPCGRRGGVSPGAPARSRCPPASHRLARAASLQRPPAAGLQNSETL